MIELVFIVMFPIFFLLAIAFGLQMWAEIIEDFVVWMSRNFGRKEKAYVDYGGYYYYRYLYADVIGIKIVEMTPQRVMITHFKENKPCYLEPIEL